MSLSRYVAIYILRDHLTGPKARLIEARRALRLQIALKYLPRPEPRVAQTCLYVRLFAESQRGRRLSPYPDVISLGGPV
ncbi:unnamed protein product, partial [Iphiclides podalirius]